MKLPHSLHWAHLAAAILGIGLIGPMPATSLSQEMESAAARQFATAAGLQNHKSYELAAEEWVRFLDRHKEDSRHKKAYYNLGVCYYLSGQFDLARETFQTIVRHFSKFEKLEAAYLYLGASQYAVAQGGKVALCREAIGTFDTLLAKFPSGKYRADAIYYRGECFYLAGDKEKSADAYRLFLRKYSGHRLEPDALYALGVCLEETSHPEEANSTYNSFLMRFPRHTLAGEIRLRKADTLFADGRYPEAAKQFAGAAADPKFPLADYATVRHADSLSQMKEYAKAAALYESVPAKFPDSKHAAPAALAAGKCYTLDGKYREARKIIEPHLASSGELAEEAAHWLARGWLGENRPAKALEVIERVLPKATSGKSDWLPRLSMDRADALSDIPNRKAEAIDLYRALATSPANEALATQARYMAGFVALELGRSTEALEHAEAFLAAHPNHELRADIMHIKAESHLLLAQHDQATALYDRLLEQHAGHADAALWRVRRALSLFLDKKYQETITTLEREAPHIRRPDQVAQSRYLVGASQLELEWYGAAVASLEASLDADPKWRQADETLLALAQAHARLDDLQEAKATLKRLIADFPKSPVLEEAHYRLGEYVYLSKDYQAAAAQYRKVIDTWPDGPLVPHALHELGCVQMDLGDNAGSERTLNRLLDSHGKHPVAPTARYSRGMVRHRQKKFAPAVEDLEAFLATKPPKADAADARYLLGLCQMGLARHGPAKATFLALLRDAPEYPNADNVLYQLAWAGKLSGNAAEAMNVFHQLTAKYPSSPRTREAYYHIGEFFYEKSDFEKAAIAYFKADAAVRKSGESELGEKAAHKLGWSYYHQEQFDNAQRTFTYQRKAYPQGILAADAAFMEAECLFKQERFAESLDAYAAVENLESEDFQALLLLHSGQAAAQVQKWQESLDLLAECTRRFPDSANVSQAFYEQGWASQKLGNAKAAIDFYQKAIRLTDREVAARAQFMIGEIQFAQKDYREAVKSYFKVMYGYSYATWQAVATYEAARCFEVLKQPDQAGKLYQELIENYPQSDKIPQARERLRQLST